MDTPPTRQGLVAEAAVAVAAVVAVAVVAAVMVIMPLRWNYLPSIESHGRIRKDGIYPYQRY